MPAAQVARQGLLRPRQPDTLYRWLNAFVAQGIEGFVAQGIEGFVAQGIEGFVAQGIEGFVAQGIEGLKVRPGAGRKPAFSPSPTYPTPTGRSRRSAASGRARPASVRTTTVALDP